MKKEILKETKEPGKSRKKKGQPKGRRNGFLEGLTGKDFTAAGLFFFSLLLCRLFVLQYGVFGSSIDWISQHSTLADYFRKRFYATGNLFPDFAWNLGGGQNIYHFAYYGLLSPTMLLSYLFPFIPMDLWVMGSSALLYAADAVLFYRWISKKGLHYGNCLFTSLFFTCSTALLYHSYNQLMFVNYMPFLMLALLGVDRHFQKRKSGLLILSVLGMILTSFYFSVGGLLALTAYAVTEYLKCGTENAAYEAEQENRKVSRNQKAGAEKKQRAGEKSAGTGETLVGLRSFFGAAIRFALPVLAGILLSGILLIPSAAALFGGSGVGGRGTAEGGIAGLFTDPAMWKPQFLILRLCYTPYGIGLSAFAGVALLGRVIGKSRLREKLLSFLLLVFFCIPLFGYLLNGGLYSKDKVFIPFLPVLCAEVGLYVENQLVRKRECGKNRSTGNFKRKVMTELRELLPYLIVLILMWNAKQETYFEPYWHLGILDVFCVTTCYLAWRWFPVKKRLRGRELPFLPLVFSAVILVFAGKAINQEKHVMISRKTYEALTDSKIAAAIREIRAEDPGWYRMEQYGDGGQNLANVNRIWDIGQNVSTIYSSAYNAEYKKFRDETYGINEAFRNRMMQTVSDDPLFWQLMGVKYILAETRPEGYELYRDYGDFQVYRAISAAPVAYVTDQVVSETEYKSLPYPQNQEILETAAVIPDQEMRKTTAAITDQEKSAKSVDNFRAAADSDTKNGSVGPLFHSCFQKVNFEIPETDQEDLRIQKTADGYEIETKKSVTVSATLPGAAEGATLLAVSFEVENQKASHDMFIRINGQTNRLTGINHTYANGNTQFNYLVTMKEDGTAFIRMGKGHYILKNFETWTGMAQPLEKTEQLYSQAVTLIGGTTATYGGDGITGVVSAERDGYLITSIPYDENFVLKVDGKETMLFRANTAFLGAKIPSGEHKIVLVYHAPGRTAGSWCSLMGGMLALILVICEKKKQQNGSERAGESKMLQKQRKYYIIRV